MRSTTRSSRKNRSGSVFTVSSAKRNPWFVRLMSRLFEKLLSLDEHVCPWWIAWTFDNPLRKRFQDPDRILGGLVREGMTVADIGCGMDYFSVAMAGMVGDKGRVIAVDLQQMMLVLCRKRAFR